MRGSLTSAPMPDLTGEGAGDSASSSKREENMAQEWKCTECGKKFKVGEWTCTDGISNHKVEEKTYRVLDAPSDPSSKDMSLKDGRTVVCNIPPPHRVMEGNDAKWVGEGSVEFIRGRYATDDPEKQYWLDKKGAYNATEYQWREVWYSDAQQLALGKMELAAARQRLESDRNELLSKTKERVGV
jgi:hypothetical protein